MERVCAVNYKPNIKPPKYTDDIFPSGRDRNDPFSLRIGDCQFFIPPEKITVDTRSNVSVHHALRQKSSIKTKSGYHTTEISLRLWFANTTHINGAPVPAPEGGYYYMDGLRSLVAQFKRSPFLPIRNEYINGVHDIWNVTLSALTVVTVPEFPNCMIAELKLLPFIQTPYTQMPEWALHDMFCWPLFRWYYQQQLRPDGQSNTKLWPVQGNSLNGDFRFRLMKEEHLENKKIGKILSDTIPIELPNTVATNWSFSLQHIINNLQTQVTDQPTHQYLGTLDTQIEVELETNSREDLVKIVDMINTSEYYARTYNDRMVSGYIKLENELVQLFGVKYVMITNFRVETVEETPGLFLIYLSFIDYNPRQYQQEALHGFSPVVDDDGWDAVLTTRPGDMNFVIHEARIEKMLNTLELYPDLELPCYRDVNNFIPKLNAFRKKHKLGSIGISQLEAPYKAFFVDPDFYIFYPSIDAFVSDADGNEFDYDSIGKAILKNIGFDKDFQAPKLDLKSSGTVEWVDPGSKLSPLTPEYTVERMCHDMTYHSKRGTMLRAFPTYVFLLVDEGQWMDGRRLWDNYYVYHSITDIAVHKTRQQPIETAYITMTNVYGNLTSYEKPLVKSNKTGIAMIIENIRLQLTDKMVLERTKLTDEMTVYAGARVHLRLGYGSSASTFPVVFNGCITEISAADEFTAVCQSDGLEISQMIVDWDDPKKHNTMFNLGNEPKNILDNLFTARNAIMTGPWGEHSRYGIEHFGYALKKSLGAVGFLLGVLPLLHNVDAYDLTKNIYKANMEAGDQWPSTFWQKVFGWLGADEEANLQIWLYGKCVWDIAQILAHASPGYIAAVHEHGFHSTFFYGRPHWQVKYRYWHVGKNEGDPNSYKEAVKPFQQIHIADSVNDIIFNDIKANSWDITTVCKAVYTLSGAMETSATMYADYSICPEDQRTDVIETSTLQDIRLVPYWLEKGFGTVTGVKPGEAVANRMAISHVVNSLKNMYQGELLILGDPAIKPHDVICLSDTYTNMFGTFEVREVVHNMSLDTGFTTTITPDICAIHADDGNRHYLLQTVLLSGVTCYSAQLAQQALVRSFVNNKFWSGLARQVASSGVVQAGKATVTTAVSSWWAGGSASAIFFRSALGKLPASISGWLGKAGTALTVSTGGVSLLTIVGVAVTWYTISKILSSIIDAFSYWNVAKLYPLTYKGKPYVAGVKGNKRLIPGNQDGDGEVPNYPEAGSETGAGSTSSGDSTDDSRWVGELCMPVDHPKSSLKPVSSGGIITSEYTSGIRQDVNTGRPHLGVDLGRTPRGSPVRAVAAGKVTTSKRTASGYGKYVTIEHNSGHKTRYFHLDDVYVAVGDRVRKGQAIGAIGDTGYAFGVHLHFEIIPPGQTRGVDPVPYLKGQRGFDTRPAGGDDVYHE